MYIHNTIISAGQYLELITGKHWDLKSQNRLEEMAVIMTMANLEHDPWDFALNEIEHVLESSTACGIVLVDIYGTTVDDDTMHHIYRWYELPDMPISELQSKLAMFKSEADAESESRYFNK